MQAFVTADCICRGEMLLSILWKLLRTTVIGKESDKIFLFDEPEHGQLYIIRSEVKVWLIIENYTFVICTMTF